jgi:two-component system sensor histidine kinase YesM
MIKRVSRKNIYLRYMTSFLLPLAVTALLTVVSGYYINGFVKEKNLRISESIARQLSADLNNILRETDLMILSYTTNLNYFKRLGSVLGAADLSYEQLQSLRTCQESLDISAKVHPYIYSVYCLPYSRQSDSDFLVSTEGAYNTRNYADRAYIEEVKNNSQESGMAVRMFKSGNLPEVPLISKYQKVMSVDHLRTEGVMAVNMDVRYIESLLNSRIRERTDDIFLIAWPAGSPVFASTEIKKLGEEALTQTLKSVENGKTVRLSGSVYYPTTAVVSNYGFTVYLMGTRASVYATSESLLAANTVVMLLSILIGGVVIVLITKRKYSDIVKIGDYIDALDEGGSVNAGISGPEDSLEEAASKYSHFTDHLRLRLSERELKERKLELQLLRSQLNPHFLLNTLQMLNWKIIREFNGYGDLNSIVENLCKILSYSLHPGESLATMAEEMRYTDSYFALQSHAKNSDIRMEWEVEEVMKQYLVPRLLFQPIIENAQKHAFAPVPRGGDEAGPADSVDSADLSAPEPPIFLIRIRIERRYDNMCIRIKDNGCGMDRATLDKIRRSLDEGPVSASGIGLSNTHKRIRLLFGRRFGVTVNSAPDRGTEVVMVIPLLVDKPFPGDRPQMDG